MNSIFLAILVAFVASISMGAAKMKPIIVGALVAIVLPLVFWRLMASPAPSGPGSTELFALTPWFILFVAFTAPVAFGASLAGAVLGNGIVAQGLMGKRRGVAAALALTGCLGIGLAGATVQKNQVLDANTTAAATRFVATSASIVAVAGRNPQVRAQVGVSDFSVLPVRIRMSVTSKAGDSTGIPLSSPACVEVSGQRDAPRFALVDVNRCP